MKRHRSRKRRHTTRRRHNRSRRSIASHSALQTSRRIRQRGGMQSPIKEAELAGVPIVAGRKQALVFRPVDRTDPHGSTDALVDMDYVANEYDPFAADPA